MPKLGIVLTVHPSWLSVISKHFIFQSFPQTSLNPMEPNYADMLHGVSSCLGFSFLSNISDSVTCKKFNVVASYRASYGFWMTKISNVFLEKCVIKLECGRNAPFMNLFKVSFYLLPKTKFFQSPLAKLKMNKKLNFKTTSLIEFKLYMTDCWIVCYIPK